MAKRVVIPCNGLATDVNPLTAGPAGGMRQADNVVIAQTGIASPRPSFPSIDQKDFVHRARSMTIYQNEAVIQAYDSGSALLSLRTIDRVLASGSADERLTPLQNPIEGLQFAQARENLYWASSNGPYKLTSTDSAVTQSGMHEATSGKFSVATTNPSASAMPPNTVRAYRWDFVKTDANGLVVRSAPSPWQDYANDTFNEYKDLIWTIPLPHYVVPGDQVELYASHTVPTGSTPSDLLFLSKKATITSADVSQRYVEVRDQCPDDRLGVDLYTNPTREGILKANGRPPAAQAITTWSDCVWFGNVVGPWTAQMTVLSSSGLVTTDGNPGLQRYRTSYGAVSGSTLTSIFATSSIRVGMLATDNGLPGTSAGRIPTGSVVTAIGSSSVTLSETPSGTGDVYFHDGVTVGSDVFWAAGIEGDANGFKSFIVSSDEERTARELCYAVSLYSDDQFGYGIEDPYVVTDATGQAAQGTAVFRSRVLNADQFDVGCTRPTAVSWNDVDTAGNPISARREIPGGVEYSKPYEPEHVPEVNYIIVGNPDAPVIALAPLRDCLLVFKRDGIWRITGTAPDRWSVDLLDEGGRLLRGTCVDVLDDAAYALTDRGLLRVTVNNVQNISDNQVSRQLAEDVIHFSEDIAQAHINVRAWRAANLILVSFDVPQENETDDFEPKVYVYNTKTSGWSTWDFGLACMAQNNSYSSANRARDFFMAEADGWNIRQNTTVYNPSSTRGYDSTYELSSWSYNHASGTITFASGSEGFWAPKVCDWVSAEYSGSPFVVWNYSGGTNLVVPKSQPDLVLNGECVAIDSGEEVYGSIISGSLAWTPSVGDTVQAIELGAVCSTDPEVRRVTAVEETSTAFRVTIDDGFSVTDQTNRRFAVTNYRRVTAVSEDEDAGTITVTLDRPFSFEAFGDRTAYEGIEYNMQWQTWTNDDPFATARMTEIQVAIDFSDSDTYNPDPYVEIGAATDLVGTPAMTEVPCNRSADEPPTRHLRMAPSNEVSFASHFYPTMEICALNLSWRILGMLLLMKPGSERTDR